MSSYDATCYEVWYRDIPCEIRATWKKEHRIRISWLCLVVQGLSARKTRGQVLRNKTDVRTNVRLHMKFKLARCWRSHNYYFWQMHNKRIKDNIRQRERRDLNFMKFCTFVYTILCRNKRISFCCIILCTCTPNYEQLKEEETSIKLYATRERVQRRNCC